MAILHGGPAESAGAVTPSDTADLGPTRALYVGVGGIVRVIMVNGQDVTFNGVQSGSVLPISVKRVLSTTTTATGIVSLT